MSLNYITQFLPLESHKKSVRLHLISPKNNARNRSSLVWRIEDAWLHGAIGLPQSGFQIFSPSSTHQGSLPRHPQGFAPTCFAPNSPEWRRWNLHTRKPSKNLRDFTRKVWMFDVFSWPWKWFVADSFNIRFLSSCLVDGENRWDMMRHDSRLHSESVLGSLQVNHQERNTYGHSN